MKTGLHIKLTVQKAKVSCTKKRGVSYDWERSRTKMKKGRGKNARLRRLEFIQ